MPGGEVFPAQLRDVLHLHPEARPVADRERALQVQAAAAGRPVLQDQDGEVAARREHEVEGVVLGQGIGGDADGRARERGRKREGLEGDGGRGVGPEARALLPDDTAVHLEGDVHAVDRARALVHEPRRRDDALASRLVVPLEVHAGDGEVGGARGRTRRSR